MDTLKKYLPFIIIGIIALYAIKKLSGSSGPSVRQVIPLTPSTDTSYSDPLLPFRAQGFQALAETAKAQIESDTALKIAKEATTRESIAQSADVQTNRFRFDLQSLLGLRELDVRELLGLRGYGTQEKIAETQSDLARYLEASRIAQQQFLQNAYLQQLAMYYQSREQDRQLQQGAIDRVNSNQRTQGILNSVNAAIQGIFGNQNNSIFRTPPTFPGFF